MYEKIKIEINSYLLDLIKQGDIIQFEAELLSEIILENIKNLIQNNKKNLDADLMYLKNKITIDENYNIRKTNHCFNYTIYPKGDRGKINKLLYDGIIEESVNGIYLPEPFDHVFLKIVRYDFKNYVKIRNLISKLTHIFTKISEIIGLLTPLPSRKVLANEVAKCMLDENSVVFSNTPAIFNPGEFKAKQKNYTEKFASSIKLNRNKFIYFWNSPKILKQVVTDYSNLDFNKEDLFKTYYNHLSGYLQNPNMTIIFGENDKVIPSWKATPYISGKRVIKGSRTDEKFTIGANWNIDSMLDYCKIIPFIGKPAGTLIEKLRNKKINEIERFGFQLDEKFVLQSSNKQDIEKFIFSIFELANITY